MEKFLSFVFLFSISSMSFASVGKFEAKIRLNFPHTNEATLEIKNHTNKKIKCHVSAKWDEVHSNIKLGETTVVDTYEVSKGEEAFTRSLGTAGTLIPGLEFRDPRILDITCRPSLGL
ncbi:MAG: hypothetical protein HRU19_16345 [Pseudobacteriovorax sp.]|nr:hypothetical protein [Pseudobacteriovorax sp.]